MFRVSFLFFLVFASFCVSQGQVLPRENSLLNYRIIGFSVPEETGNGEYLLEVAKGDQKTEELFKKNIVQSVKSKQNKIIAEVPIFGGAYTWHMVYTDGGSKKTTELHHFSTVKIQDADTSFMKVRILRQAEKYKDAFVFLDLNRTLYDMKGNPVWYLPLSKDLNYDTKQTRDLKITSSGTITFLVGGQDAYEIDYNGNVLWKAPKKKLLPEDSNDRYNHELTKLGNGHFIVLGSEFTWSDPDEPPPTPGHPPPPPKPGAPPKLVNHRVLYGVIYEYDQAGNLVWSWRSAQYFQHSDVANYPFMLSGPMDDVHQNSFFFDEKNKVVYVSYKNIHRIIKVKYPEGNVIAAYGEKYELTRPVMGNDKFCYQHSCRISQNGYLYFLNNNSCHLDQVPKITMLKEPASDKDSVKVVWEYEFPVTKLSDMIREKHHGGNDETTGGNVSELTDGSFFASVCAPYSDLFIVSKEKKVLWHAQVERWIPEQKKWSDISIYRASIIPGRKELEQLIWNSETGK